MNHALRIVALAAVLLGLSGCNVVVSEDPWFTVADAAPAPVLRDGLWLKGAPDCRFDDAKPAEQWPDCADGFFVRGDERWSMHWDDADVRGKRRRTFAGWEPADPFSHGLFVANGDHLIVQFQTKEEPDLPPSDAEAGEAGSRAYLYGAIRPHRLDDEGKWRRSKPGSSSAARCPSRSHRRGPRRVPGPIRRTNCRHRLPTSPSRVSP